MAQMTIRSIDDQVYRRLKEQARLHRRSLEGEVRAILDHAVRADRTELIRYSADLRDRLNGRYTGDATADIRSDRDR